jgi:hypothetical protein
MQEWTYSAQRQANVSGISTPIFFLASSDRYLVYLRESLIFTNFLEGFMPF